MILVRRFLHNLFLHIAGDEVVVAEVHGVAAEAAGEAGEAASIRGDFIWETLGTESHFNASLAEEDCLAHSFAVC